MNRVLKGLAILLGVQLALVALTWWPRGAKGVAPHPFLDISTEAVDRVVVEGDPEAATPREPVELERRDDRWVIASLDGYPADPDRVKELIERFTEARVARAVATRPTSHAHLQVAEDAHKRRVTLRAGETEQVVYVGPASSRGVYARRADQDEVHRLRGFSVWSIGDQARSYWDPDLLRLERDQLVGLRIVGPRGAIELLRDQPDEPWRLADQAEDEELDLSKVDRLVRQASSLRLVEPVAREAGPEHGFDQGITVYWTLADEDQTVTGAYRLGATEDSRTYVRVGEDGWVVRVYRSSVADVLDVTRDGLLAGDGGA